MNILLIIVLVLLICKIRDGYKRGMVKEIISFVSLIILCIVLALLANGVSNYFDKKYINVALVVILLIIIAVVHHLLGILFFSAKLVVKLPIVSWADKLLGIVVGILETILILWTLYTFVMLMDLGAIGTQIVSYTKESNVLLWFYENNYLAYLLESVSSKINFNAIM